MSWANDISVVLGISFSIYFVFRMMRAGFNQLGWFFLAYIGILLKTYYGGEHSYFLILSQLYWVIGPLLYLFITSTKKTEQRNIFYHFVPFFFALIINFWLFILPSWSIAIDMVNSQMMRAISHPVLPIIHCLIYVLLSAFEVKNNKWKKLMILASIPLFAFTYLQEFNLFASFDSSIIILPAILLFGFSCIKVGKSGWHENCEIKKSIEQNIEEEIELLQEIYSKVLEKINDNQFYLNQNLKLSDFTEELGVTEKLISKAINTYAKENFNAFINRFRVKHAVDLINSEKYSYYTIDAIAEESGFSNKVSFYKAFKRIEDISPSKYRQNAQNGAEQATNSLP